MAEQDRWEQEVRRTLAGQAGAGRTPATDLAGVALARARRARRRRRLAGLAGVVAAAGLATGVLAQGWLGPGERAGTYIGLFGDPVVDTPVLPDQPDRPARGPVRLAADQAVPVHASTDVIGIGEGGGLVLAAADGRTTDLGSITNVASAYELGGGWAVVSGQPGAVRLWWVSADDRPVAVLSGVDSVAVGDGQVAWRRGSMLSTAQLSSGGDLEQRVDTRVPEGGADPVGFLGEAVLLGRTGLNGAASWDVWQPAGGDYQPGWTSEVVRIYGLEPGGTAIGLLSPGTVDEGPCLARLRVGHSLAVTGQACLPGLPPLGAAKVSPEGQWLIAITDPAADPAADPADGAVADLAGAAGVDAPAVVVDLAAAFAGSPGAFAGVAGVGDPAGRPVWLTAETAAFPTADTVVRVWPSRLFADAPDAVEVISLAGEAPVLVEADVQ